MGVGRGRQLEAQLDGQHYHRVMKRLNDAHARWAFAIHALIALSVLPNWRHVGWMVGAMVVLIPVNAVITLKLVPRRMVLGEGLRMTVNTVATAVLCHAVGWPVSGWLWLPFIALGFDARRITLVSLVVMWCVTTPVALYDGVSWVYPASFGLIAYLARSFTAARVRILEEMLEESEVQKRALDDAFTDLQRETSARQAAELELRQAQKLEAVGRLAAGVAHEINTPLQYVNDCLTFVADAAHSGPVDPDVDESLTMMKEGLTRMSVIVASMRQFAHPDRDERALFDVNAAVTATLNVATHEYKYVADVKTELGALPPVLGFRGAISQVLLNLVVNAAHAISDVVATDSAWRGELHVRTYVEGGSVVISVGDNGRGIPATVQDRIFEPFFTTKEVGRGTGQGLAISRSIVDKHGGTLTFDTGEAGTTFFVRLPVGAPADTEEAA